MMDEQDRKRVNNVKAIINDDDPFCHGFSFCSVTKLVNIIDRLDSQLTGIVEAWEPFRKARQQMGEHYPDYYVITFIHPIKGMELRVGDFRRLAEAVRKIKEDAT